MTSTPRDWAKILSAYKQPDDKRAIIELAVTSILFAGAWFCTWWALQLSVWFGLALTIVPAALLVRMFAIQHDCGHNSLFRSRRVNDWIGRGIGVLTFTPYDYWKHCHALHHATSGNLDKRGVGGDIMTLTVAEYEARSVWGKILYRLYRNPLTLFLVGPAYMFLLEQRLPIGFMTKGIKPWLSTQSTNIGIALGAIILIYFIGWVDFVLIQIPIVMIGASIGVWLFFVQHQFEETLWEKSDDWNREHLAMHGSSYYDLPKPLMWLTGNIGIHHVHHVVANIPFHRLPKTLEDHPVLKEIGRLTLWESIKCVPLSLWDEGKRELISFREHRRRRALVTA